MQSYLRFLWIALWASFFTTAQSQNLFPRLIGVEGQSQDQGNVSYKYSYSDQRLDSIVSEQKNFKLKQIFSYQDDHKISQIEEMQWSNYLKTWTKANLYSYKYNKQDGSIKNIVKKVISGDRYAEYEDYSYSYDAERRLILIEVYDYSRDFTYKEIHYSYDTAGRKSQVITKQSVADDGNLKESKREDYTYDDKGRLAKKTVSIRYNGAMTPDKVYNYTYDEQGGCTEIAITPVGVKFATEIRRFTNNNDIDTQGVFLATHPQLYFPDFEVCPTLKLSEEVILVDIKGKETQHSLFKYSYADLPKNEQPNITIEVDGSVKQLSFSVTTAQPLSKVKVVFPDGSVAEEESDKEYGIARFGKWIQGSQKGEIKIYADLIVAIAAQQTGITQVRLDKAPLLKRLTIPYQNISQIDLSKTPNLEELYLHGCTKLQQVDVTGLKKLKRLNIANNEQISILGLNDISTLESLTAYNSGLRNPKPSQWLHLKELDLTNTALETIDLSKNKELTHLELTDNRLSSIQLSANSHLKVLKIAKNKLTSIDLSALQQLEELDVNGNELDRLELHSKQLTNLDCGNNRLSLAALPAKGTLTTYIYWPQRAFTLPETVILEEPLDLHAFASLVGVLGTPTPTTFALLDKQGNEFDSDTYYTLQDGVFTFKQAIETPVRIRTLNKAFPKLTGKTASYSTFFTIKSSIASERITLEKPYRISGNRLSLETSSDKEYRLFDIMGACLLSAPLHSPSQTHEITLTSGSYVLRIGNQSYKIWIP